MTVKPHAVIFDVGHVLFDWDVARIYEEAIPDAAARAAFVRDVVNFAWHEQHDAGVPFAETSAALAARYPQHAELIALFGPRFNDSLTPLPGMAEIVAELDARGVPLYAITNFSAEFWAPFVVRESALFGRFRDIVVSGEERLAKPDPAIFDLALRRFGLDEGEAIFIDDRADNVAGAEAAGMMGHVFLGPQALRAVLVELGLLDA